jgi:hypothetical protein
MDAAPPPDDPLDAPLAVLRPSPPRRIFGAGLLAGLGALTVWIGLRHPADPLVWSLVLIALGVASLWLAMRLWSVPAGGLVLTRRALTTDAGEVIARIEDLVSVERGPFAVKPASGFALVLRARAPAAWVPGLWWRRGRRIGVGGITHRHEARFMAERIEELLRARP